MLTSLFNLVTDNYSPGFLSAPRTFKCNITPRDDKVKGVVGAEFEAAKSVFKEYTD